MRSAVSSDRVEAPRYFILQGIHPERKVPVLEARFRVDKSDELRLLLGSVPDSDTELTDLYYPTEGELEAITRRFDVAFESHGWVVRLHDEALRGTCPYLLHSGHELQMLLDGTKQFATQDGLYPPHKHDGEDRFDSHVAAGRLYKEVVLEIFDSQVQRKDGRILEGIRSVYYTRKGEEWRVPAWKMLWSAAASQQCGDGYWNNGYERLMSMLFGYEDWQTDWWVKFIGDKGGSWRGMTVYVPVGDAQLSSIEGVGLRAFPPTDGTPLTFNLSDERPTEEEASRMMGPAATALIRAFIRARYLAEFVKGQPGPCYSLPSNQIPDLNRHILRGLEVVARRGSPRNASPEQSRSASVQS